MWGDHSGVPKTSRFPGIQSFSAKTRPDPGKPGQLVTLVAHLETICMAGACRVSNEAGEVGSLKSRCWQCHAPSEGSRAEALARHLQLWWLRHSWALAALLQALALSSHGLSLFCVSNIPLPFSYKDTCHCI